MGSIPCKPVACIKPAGLFVFPQDEHESVVMPCQLQAAAGLFHQDSAVPLTPLVGMGIEGRDLSPALIGTIVKLADLAGVVVFHACGAEVDAGNRNISSVKQKACIHLVFPILSEHVHPAIIGDFGSHKVRRNGIRIGVPPTQRVNETHGPKMLLGAGFYDFQLLCHTAAVSRSSVFCSCSCFASALALASISLMRFS